MVPTRRMFWAAPAGSIGEAENVVSSAGASNGEALPEKSAPAQNARPAPVTTMARTSSFSSQSRYARLSSVPISAV